MRLKPLEWAKTSEVSYKENDICKMDVDVRWGPLVHKWCYLEGGSRRHAGEDKEGRSFVYQTAMHL